MLQDIKTIYHMARGAGRGRSHAERLENFYQGQAGSYDHFRRRLLHGRRSMYQQIPCPDNGIWIDMGGGTGANLEGLAERMDRFQQIYLVDLCPSLLQVARERIARRRWTRVTAVQADVTEFHPPQGQAQVVTFSYSLTMIPQWAAAIEHAHALLAPGGHIGVVDFYTSPAQWDLPLPRPGWLSRQLWPRWFARDHVFLNADHPLTLAQRFTAQWMTGDRGSIPYLPGLRVPYYQFIGRKD